MAPRLSPRNHRDGWHRDSELRSDFFLRDALTAQAQYLRSVGVGQDGHAVFFPTVGLKAKHVNSVLLILAFSYVLQIAHSVIRRVSVFVVDFKPGRALSNECQHDELVELPSSTPKATEQRHALVRFAARVTAGVCRQDLRALRHLLHSSATDAAQVTHVVVAPIWDRSPLFHQSILPLITVGAGA